MSKMKQEDVERIATEHLRSVGSAPFVVDGSEFHANKSPPTWNVYVSFCESSENRIGLPDGLVVEVDDATGEASHIQSL